MFRRILIANRGEIALRILRTCRSMGIETVAVYSSFDQNAPHVRFADLAVPIGPAAARDSYLNASAILAAAKSSGAQAIHPGYGFLAENPGFAEACEGAGITFIGPSSRVIRAMGSKIAARELAQKAGVPTVGSFSLGNGSGVDFPVLIKASSGGGGRGMRIVRTAAEFEHAAREARGEAERAFADGTLLVEKFVEGARHVEIQIFGDRQGKVIHLFERDCSVQRRYQKVIEESPSPAVTPEIRQRMAEAAVTLARAIGYTGAGTVEFLLAPSGDFYFIEVNARIQVEHPVTEMITGLDLIRLQIEIAQGLPLPPQPPRASGHAIEARLYAEDPSNSFLPAAGTLHVWQPPVGIAGVRVDSGVEEGMEIGVHYDSLLAKVIAHAQDRESAINKLAFALKGFAAQGIATNREFLIDVLEHEDFRQGRAHTGWQLTSRASSATREPADEVFVAVTAAYIEHTEHARRRILPSLPLRYRNNPYPRPAMRFEIGGREFPFPVSGLELTILGVRENRVEVLVDGVRHQFWIQEHGSHYYYVRSRLTQRTVTRLPRYPGRSGGGSQDSANSPMPGQVLRILVKEGQSVKPGDPLVALEAMKMEQTIKAAREGVVKAILVKPGQMVAPGQMLVEVQSTEDPHEHANSSAGNR
jgi:propionyl-CoA carboxylase alpha chain